MRTETMDQYTLQSYFKSLCNSFYIAYQEVKRLEKLREELDSACPDEELQIVEDLLKISVSEELKQKYMTQKYSRKELEEQKEKLELAEKEYDEKCEKLDDPIRFWVESMRNDAKRIAIVLEEIKENSFSIIVTSKEEIIALMAYFRKHSVKDHGVINTDEMYLKSFPTGEEMYEEFFKAYCLELYAAEKGIDDDSELMKEVCKKYF